MKKLLSLLSFLTISGSAVPTTIAASPYQKQENVNIELNNNINIKLWEIININANILETICFKDKLYIVSSDGKVYEYNPETKEQKIVISTNSSFLFGGSVLNNKIYFGSSDGKVYEYNPETKEQKIVLEDIINGFESSILASNNKLYFISYDNNIKNNYKVYEYNPETKEQKIVINTKTNNLVPTSGIILNNKLYFISYDNNIWEYDFEKKIKYSFFFSLDDHFSSKPIVLNNKLYFYSDNNNLYEYDPINKSRNTIIKSNDILYNSGVILKNKLYFSSYGEKIYEYDPNTKNINIFSLKMKDNDNVLNPGVILNNKLYFYSDNNNLYEYDPISKKQYIINLSNKFKENEYLSSVAYFNNRAYFCFYNKKNLNYKIYECSDDLQFESNIINMKEYLKMGLYLQYKKENVNFEIKEILNINLENLTVSDVVIESNQKNKPINLENEINVCLDSSSTFINNSDTEQTNLTTACSKQLIETNTTQKMNGFSKSESTANNDNWTAKWGGKFTFKASGSAGIPLVAEGKVESGFEASHETSWGKSRTETITDTSNSSDTEIKTTTNTTTITVPSQSVKIPAHSKISISVTTWKNNIELILNTSQKVEGIVSADFIDKNNESKKIYISIKDAMLNLLENNILPSKIKINDDSSINFLYENKIKMEIIMHQTEIGKAIPLQE